jgi:hypothetical protein
VNGRESATVRYIRNMREQDARQRLTRRYALSTFGSRHHKMPPLGAAEAIAQVRSALNRQDGYHRGAVRTKDLLDALALVSAVRRGMDWDERILIAAAVTRGASWALVAQRLGMSDAEEARQRYKDLCELDASALAEDELNAIRRIMHSDPWEKRVPRQRSSSLGT